MKGETRFWRNFGWALRPTSTHKWARVTTDRFCQNLFFMPKKKNQDLPAGTPSAPLPTSEEFSRQLTFDAMEDRIRGEEVMQQQEQKKLKETQDLKKKMNEIEVDKKLDQLRKKMGLKK